MRLPEHFVNRMKKQLGVNYEAFEASYDREHYVSLKINTLKISVEKFIEIFPYPLKPVPWTEDGFYYRPEDPVTKHPYFYAGLFYVQEPSAMSPVVALAPKPGDLCLDTCAAPGGKSMQIATQIMDHGLLVTNDINETRVKAILRNSEKFGLRNVLILNESPEKIVKAIGNRFNRILVDAPCSGEGMFRKDPKAIKSYETFGPLACQEMQRGIIDQLEGLVASNAVIVYSTCTFAPEENEDQIQYLLECSDRFKERAIDLNTIEFDDASKPYMTHIWPHLHKGEGHFIASIEASDKIEHFDAEVYPCNQPPEAFVEFMKVHLKRPLAGYFSLEGEKLYLKPELKVPTKGLKVVREGLLLGELKKGRFAPSQALAMYLKMADFHPVLDLPASGDEVTRYLKGETVFVGSESSGLHLICTDGYPIGFAKISNGTLKNMYPVSWRMM